MPNCYFVCKSMGETILKSKYSVKDSRGKVQNKNQDQGRVGVKIRICASFLPAESFGEEKLTSILRRN